MATTNPPGDSRSARERAAPSTRPEREHLRSWELVEEGRYRPLRTRGSFPGRELG
jgi:hypothetical protein